MILILKIGTLLAFACSAVVSFQLWPYRRSFLTKMFSINLGLWMLWAFWVVLTLITPDEGLKILFTKVRQLTNPFITVNWLMVILFIFYRSTWFRIQKYYFLAYILPIITSVTTLLSVLGSDYSATLVAHDFHLMKNIDLMSYTSGPILQLQFLYAGVAMMMIAAIYVSRFWSKDEGLRKMARLFAGASLVQILVEFGSRTSVGGPAMIQMSIATVVPVILVLYIAIRKLEFLNIKSFANQVAFNNLPTPVITINPRNQIWDANHSAIDLFKIKNDEIGQTIEEDPRFEFITQNRNAVTIAERVYQVKNESLEVSSLDRAGRIISLHDITEIQSLNEELKESNEILRTMNSEILKVTSFNRKIQTVLSHDLSALLRTGSNLFRGMAPSIPKEDSRIATSLENTLQSSLGLLNNILRWSHDEQISQFNLAALIASVRANVQPMAQENNVSIDVDLDRTEYSLELSQGVLDAILRNLISNAIKASPRGGLVKIKVHSEDKSLFIAVIDEGSGIDPQIIEGIYQTKPYSANGPSGFGVGLQFTYNFIRQLGGELRFKPNSPQGTIVEVTIPSRNLPVLK